MCFFPELTPDIKISKVELILLQDNASSSVSSGSSVEGGFMLLLVT